MEQTTTIDLANLLKAQAMFERFRQDMKNDRDQVGAVHAFKVCYESAWKMMKRALAINGVESSSPKDIFRKAVAAGLIDSPEIWFDFLEKRSLTAYTYEQENVDSIVGVFDQFSAELDKMIQRIRG